MKYVGSLLGPSGGPGDFEEATYDGDWKAGKRDGQGVMRWADGSCYRGSWRNDMRHEGEMKMANGNVYIGRFKDDKFNGQSRLLLATGLIYEGSFNAGVC
jgi:hypothetical protein